MAIIQFIKYLLAYLDKHSKQWRNKAGPAGWVLKYLFKCLICCVWLLEKIMQFVNRQAAQLALTVINAGPMACLLLLQGATGDPPLSCRNAYIMVAVHGTGYCTSAMHAVKLLVMNALRVVAVNVIGDILIFLGKVRPDAGAVHSLPRTSFSAVGTRPALACSYQSVQPVASSPS